MRSIPLVFSGGVLFLSLFSSVLAAATPLLCLSGSNTVGQALAPKLVAAWAADRGWRVLSVDSSVVDESRIRLLTEKGERRVDVLAHGTSTGFAALRDGECDLWMASRPVNASEVEAARGIGPLFERGQEHVLALDGLSVIVHPANRLSSLTIEQVRGVFAGRITDWASLGGVPGPIALHARDDRSGTYDTFKALVLADARLSGAAQRYESTDALSAAVASDPRAIGFVGLAGVGRAKPLALSERGTMPLAPTALAVATEDYLLARRLFLYSGGTLREDVRGFIDFALGPKGQSVVAAVGFVPQRITALSLPAPEVEAYREIVVGSRRLSLNFRFGEGAAVLDNKALSDIERLAEYLRSSGGAAQELVLVGFADRSESTPYLALSLSNDRVDLVASELRARGMRVARQRGLGQLAPVASNDTQAGRLKNRRVEVWVRPAQGLARDGRSAGVVVSGR